MSFVSSAPRPPIFGAAAARPRAASPTVAAVIALVAAGAILRFWALGHQSLWYDESYTEMLVRLGPGKMIGLIPQTESTPPLYYCIAWGWVRVFGYGAASLRSLSAAVGVLMIPVAYGAAAEMIGTRRAGIVCAALTAFNPFLWWYAQEARSYEMLAMFTALSLWTYARARSQPSGGRIALWVIASALAMATHYFAALLVVPEAIALLIEHRRRRPAQIGVGIAGLCGIALVPLALSQNGTGNDSWIGHSSLSVRLAQILPELLIGTDSSARVIVKYVAFALAIVAIALLRWASPQQRRGALLAAALAVAGFAIALILIVVGFDDVITRNLIELWMPLAVCASGGLAAARARAVGGATTAGLCAIGLIAIVGVIATPRFQRPEWRQLAAMLGHRPPPGQTRVVLIQRYGTLLPLSLSLPGLHALTGPVRASEVDVIAMDSPGQPLCWWGAQCNLISSPLQRHYRLPGFSGRHGYRRVSQFRVAELRASPPTLVTPAQFQRMLTLTHLTHDILMVQRG